MVADLRRELSTNTIIARPSFVAGLDRWGYGHSLLYIEAGGVLEECHIGWKGA